MWCDVMWCNVCMYVPDLVEGNSQDFPISYFKGREIKGPSTRAPLREGSSLQRCDLAWLRGEILTLWSWFGWTSHYRDGQCMLIIEIISTHFIFCNYCCEGCSLYPWNYGNGWCLFIFVYNAFFPVPCAIARGQLIRIESQTHEKWEEYLDVWSVLIIENWWTLLQFRFSHPPNIKHSLNGPNGMWKFPTKPWFRIGGVYYERGMGLVISWVQASSARACAHTHTHHPKDVWSFQMKRLRRPSCRKFNQFLLFGSAALWKTTGVEGGSKDLSQNIPVLWTKTSAVPLRW